MRRFADEGRVVHGVPMRPAGDQSKHHSWQGRIRPSHGLRQGLTAAQSMQQPGKEVPLLGRTGAMQHTLDGDFKGQAAARPMPTL
jgi:hypothetical protein